MPFVSQAQRKKFHAMEERGEIPRGTTARWERHTPKGKPLPRHAADKKAFVAGFLLKCAAAGLTTAAEVADAAERFAAAAEQTAKQAVGPLDVGDAGVKGVGNLASTWALTGALGTLALPAVAGTVAGGVAAGARNKMDDEDARALRLAAVANAYRRRTAEAQTNAQVRKLVASDPSKYVVLG